MAFRRVAVASVRCDVPVTVRSREVETHLSRHRVCVFRFVPLPPPAQLVSVLIEPRSTLPPPVSPADGGVSELHLRERAVIVRGKGDFVGVSERLRTTRLLSLLFKRSSSWGENTLQMSPQSQGGARRPRSSGALHVLVTSDSVARSERFMITDIDRPVRSAGNHEFAN